MFNSSLALLLLLPLASASLMLQKSESAATFSTLQTIKVDGTGEVAVYRSETRFEAPNWSREGKSLVFDQGGRIMTLSLAGGAPTAIETGQPMRCNGSHGFSPDGKLLAISCSTPELPESRIYLISALGKTPSLLTTHPNSYFHSWSPDGRTILFTRPDHQALNIFAISSAGGDEVALTSGPGVSDDPDYAADGASIYFNSDRSGSMQIWRMHFDGTAPEQVTTDTLANWTPHPSPNGKWVVFLSYPAGTTGHPPNRSVSLRLLCLHDGRIHVLTNLIGGAGTINVPSWSPDSSQLAFVRYTTAS